MRMDIYMGRYDGGSPRHVYRLLLPAVYVHALPSLGLPSHPLSGAFSLAVHCAVGAVAPFQELLYKVRARADFNQILVVNLSLRRIQRAPGLSQEKFMFCYWYAAVATTLCRSHARVSVRCASYAGDAGPPAP